MSKSYRKPYGTFCSNKRSCAWDKTTAARSWRRVQNNALRNHTGDYEDLLLPARFEAAHNNVYGWRRDGKQRLQQLDHNYFNPYWVVDKWTPWTEEQLVQHCEERIERNLQWIAYLSRK